MKYDASFDDIGKWSKFIIVQQEIRRPRASNGGVSGCRRAAILLPDENNVNAILKRAAYLHHILSGAVIDNNHLELLARRGLIREAFQAQPQFTRTVVGGNDHRDQRPATGLDRIGGIHFASNCAQSACFTRYSVRSGLKTAAAA